MAALQASEAKLRLAQQVSGSGVWDWNRLTNSIEWTAEVYRILGIDPKTPPNRLYEAWLDVLHPDDREDADSAARRAVTQRTSFSIDLRIIRPTDRKLRWIRSQAEIVLDQFGNLDRIIGIVLDITNQHEGAENLQESERRQRFLLELNDQLRDLLDPADIMAAATEALARHLRIARVGYGEVDRAQDHLVVQRDWTDESLASVVGRHRLSDFGTPIIDELKAGTTVGVDDMTIDARTRGTAAAAFATIGVRALLAVPLVKKARLRTILFLHHPEPRAWTEADIALIEDVAQRTWSAVERARAEGERRESQEELKLVTDSVPVLISFIDADGIYRFANRAYETWYGLMPENVVGRHVREVVGDSGYALRLPYIEAALHGTESRLDVMVPRPDGRPRHGEVRYIPRRDRDGRVDGFYAFVVDVTERKAAEEALQALNEHLEATIEERTRELRTAEDALRQSQKMEAIGQLTGGIAHDFNNILAAITGGLDLTRRRIAAGRADETGKYIEAALTASNRAAALTQRLLAFARRQSLDAKPVDVNGLVASMGDLLRRTTGGSIEIKTRLEPSLGLARTDVNQLESSLLNLAINARDAMPAGGTLTIATTEAAAETLAPDAARELQPGRYVAIEVSDTGAGMSPEVLAKAFDPFFTTKPIGQGTGLGLSMVYGFARQTGGHVRIESLPGKGTTVLLYLPRHHGPRPVAMASGQVVEVPRAEAGETVLVVEDEQDVRMLVVEVLRDLGYTAIEAQDAKTALPSIEHANRIDLLVTDVGLPGMNGRQLAEIARQHRPGLRVLFITGYAEGALARHGFLEPGMDLIAKPFALDHLAGKIREMVGQS
jgi:PAS domain S-box-containing protein